MRLSTLLIVVLVIGLLPPAVLGDAAKNEQTAAGTVKSVSEKDNQFVLTVNGKDQTFRIADSAKVQVGDKEAKLADLKPGDTATVRYRMQARGIRRVEGMQARGEIKGLAKDRSFLILKDAQGKEHTFMLDKGSTVRLADKEGKIADLKLSDEVVIGWEKKGDQMMARHVRAHRGGRASHLASGEVAKVAADKNELILKDARGNERSFQLAKDAKVRVGDKDSKLADLKEGDKVNLTYAQVVTNVQANRRK